MKYLQNRKPVHTILGFQIAKPYRKTRGMKSANVVFVRQRVHPTSNEPDSPSFTGKRHEFCVLWLLSNCIGLKKSESCIRNGRPVTGYRRKNWHSANSGGDKIMIDRKGEIIAGILGQRAILPLWINGIHQTTLA